MPTVHDFDVVARQQREALGASSRDDELLIRCAALAASSHNTQPWTFEVAPDSITIRADLTRRCPVVDPDDAHLFKSLGCAAENLVIAAAAQGLDTDVRFDPARDAVVVHLSPSTGSSSTAAPSTAPSTASSSTAASSTASSTAASSTELFDAIGGRQCTRLPFDGTAVAVEHLTALERAGSGLGVRTIMIADPAQITAISDLVALGNTAQLTDRRFRRELLAWIRFNPTTALRSGDGLAGRCTGNPPVPTWLGRLVAPIVLRASRQAARDAANIRSSAGIAVFVAAIDDIPTWIETGRAYERFALQATALDIRTAFINQPIEVGALRGRFETLLGLDGEHAMLAVRFGHGPLAPFSVRRPINETTTRP